MKTITYSITKLRIVMATIITSLMVACSDFIEIDPPKTEIVSQSVFTSDASVASAIRGIYSLMMSNTSFTKAGIEEFTGSASDELINYSARGEVIQFYQNSLTSTNSEVLATFWREAYKYIHNANAILEGINGTTQMSVVGKMHAEGEAKFIRAFNYYYLVTLFGDIPYVTSTDYRVNEKIPRTPSSEVLESIILDLVDAIELLPDNFNASNGERVQPNKGAAIAFLARLYLQQADWLKAEEMASLVIANTATYTLLPDLNGVFLKNSKETIWQLKPVIPGSNTPQGQLFILTAAPNTSSRRVTLTNNLIDAFETNDLRKQHWVGSFTNTSGTWYFPYKYKVALNTSLTEYTTVLRLAEQYLIRAEARVHLNNFAGAREDINSIRTRAGLDACIADDNTSLLLAIEQERRVELFTEWGHRWLDLKRTNRIDEILQPIKSDWQSTDKLFPIPEAERLLNTNLTQNLGY